MKKAICTMGVALCFVLAAAAQAQEAKVPLDTLTVQAEGTFEADPDLATLRFVISVQEKELRRAYDRATESLNRVLQLAERNGIPKADIATGAFTVLPVYDWSDRKRRTRAYRVENRITLRVRDFSKIGGLMDESVQDEITDLRSLTYSLADEEAAKQKAVAEAMRRAEERARAALGQNGRKLGALRYVSLDVKQPVGIVRAEPSLPYSANFGLTESMEVRKAKESSFAPMPVPVPERISVTASVHCIFQLM